MNLEEMKSVTFPVVLVACLISAAIAACAGEARHADTAPTAATDVAPVNPPATSSAVPAATTAVDDALGGRLYDQWYAGKSFRPDDAKTPAIDGQGGPFGDGSLAGSDGKPRVDGKGHQTRLKNFFGWDLRGAQGVYGPKYQAKSYVSSRNLLGGRETREELAELFGRGDGEVPSFASVLTANEIAAIADFIVGVRDGKLAHPEKIFSLSEKAPGNYELRAGGDPSRGAKLFRERCSECHGADGTKILFDGGEYSLGSHARQKAYEDWFKILNGQPNSPMGRQVKGVTGVEMSQEILDILAALCDRKAYPKGVATKADVPDGDLRCGPYLR